MALIRLEEAKQYLRVDSHDEDALIGILLESVGQMCADVARLSAEQWKAVDSVEVLEDGSVLPTETDLYTETELATPVAMPGAVSLSLDPNGEPSTFYADGYAYYTISNNMGYEGDLELAMVPEHFRTEILKETLDDNKVLVEDASVQGEKFALLFEFDGDIRKIRHVLYCCTAARPGIESSTNEDEIEVKTETLSIKASPLANGYVKARTGDDTTVEVYNNWYKSVYMTAPANPAGEG